MDKQKNIIDEIHRDTWKGIVFDFDGTIFNLDVRWDDLREAVQRTVQSELKIPEKHFSLSYTIHAYKNTNPGVYKKLLALCAKYEQEGLLKGWGNDTIINYLKKPAAKKHAIYTMNTSNTIKEFLKTYGLENVFDMIVTQDTSKNPKPHDKDLLRIADAFSISKNELLYIGNSEADRLSGEMAQVTTIII